MQTAGVAKTTSAAKPVSLTGSESFRLRIQRSEASRAGLVAAVYFILLLLTLARRLAGGAVMSDDRVFVPSVVVFVLALAYELFAARAMRKACTEGRLVQQWRLTLGGLVELAVPASLLLIMHVWSPRGSYAALSAPALLLMPLTILLSVLRLRPRATLWMGLGMAAIHAVLTLLTIAQEKLPAEQYPVLLSYSVLLALTGVAGRFVTAAARRYVAEVVDESTLREQAALKLAGVERDLEVARQIQTGLLPSQSPTLGGFEFAGMSSPADQTGGDYYDWQPMPDGRLLVAIADVTGHGIGPALVMAVCRAYSRASAPASASPASHLRTLNELLIADDIGGRFITLAMAVLNSNGNAELVSAGHGPTFLYRAASRHCEIFGGDGLPLAVMPNEEYAHARQLTMEKGDVLVMLTDGVFEWQNPRGEQFGVQRIEQLFQDVADQPADHIMKQLDAAVRVFSEGSVQADDVTIVVIKRTG